MRDLCILAPNRVLLITCVSAFAAIHGCSAGIVARLPFEPGSTAVLEQTFNLQGVLEEQPLPASASSAQTVDLMKLFPSQQTFRAG